MVRLNRVIAQQAMRISHKPPWSGAQPAPRADPWTIAVIPARNKIPGHQNLVANRIPRPISQTPPVTALARSEFHHMSRSRSLAADPLNSTAAAHGRLAAHAGSFGEPGEILADSARGSRRDGFASTLETS